MEIKTWEAGTSPATHVTSVGRKDTGHKNAAVRTPQEVDTPGPATSLTGITLEDAVEEEAVEAGKVEEVDEDSKLLVLLHPNQEKVKSSS